MEIIDINAKLDKLRDEWKEKPERRWLIKRQARALQLALEKKQKYT